MPEAPRYPAIPEPAQTLESIQVTTKRLKEAVEMLTGQRGPAEYSLVEGMLQIRKQVVAAERTLTASITELNEVVVDADSAFAQRTSLIESEITDARDGKATLKAKITDVATTSVNADLALAQRATNLESEVTTARGTQPTLTARIGEVASTSASATSAVASRTTTLETTITNALKKSDGSTAATLVARMQAIDKAVVDGDGALATSLNTLSTTVNGHTSSINTLTTSVNGISVSFGVQGVINGVTGGFQFTGVRRNDGAVAYNMEFNSNVTINGDLLINGSINTPKVINGAISNMSAITDQVLAPYTTSNGCYINTRAGARVLVQVSMSPEDETGAVGSNAAALQVRLMPIYFDNIGVTNIQTLDVLYKITNLNGITYFWLLPAPSTKVFMLSGLPEGPHYAQLVNNTAYRVNCSIVLTELAR